MDIQQTVRDLVDRHADNLDPTTLKVLVELCDVGEWALALDEFVAALRARRVHLNDEDHRDLAGLLAGLGRPAEQLDW